MAEFDVERYTGTWYEIVRDRTTPFELLMGCVVAQYDGPDPTDGSIGVTNSGFNFKDGWTSAHGNAVQVGKPGTGSLAVAFDGMPEQLVDDEPNYLVIDTDYDTYSIVYSCGNVLGFFTFDMLWVLAREPTLSEDTLTSIRDKIETVLPDYNLSRQAHFTR